MAVPTQCPAPNITLPVQLVRTRDGDTPEVRLAGSSYIWAIRLADCWVPELHRGSAELQQVSARAWKFADDVLKKADDLFVYFDLPEEIDVADFNVLKLPTFDRLLGWLFIGRSQTLNRMLVQRGLASTKKHGALGR